MIFRWINSFHGLELEPDHSEDSRGNENGIYFLAHLLMLKDKLKELDPELINTFKTIVKNIESYDSKGSRTKGCYDRGSNESLRGQKEKDYHVRQISHDNITGVFTGSILADLDYHKEIAKFGIDHKMAYDNAQPEKPRLFLIDHKGKYTTSYQIHPRDIFFWLHFSGNKKRVWFLYPIYFLMQIVDMATPIENTSSKLLGILRLETTYKKSLTMRLLRYICYEILKAQYGEDFLPKIYKRYFWQEDHPLPKLALAVYNQTVKQ